VEGVGLRTGVLLDLPGYAFAHPDTQRHAHAVGNNHGHAYRNSKRHAIAIGNAYGDGGCTYTYADTLAQCDANGAAC